MATLSGLMFLYELKFPGIIWVGLPMHKCMCKKRILVIQGIFKTGIFSTLTEIFQNKNKKKNIKKRQKAKYVSAFIKY